MEVALAVVLGPTCRRARPAAPRRPGRAPRPARAARRARSSGRRPAPAAPRPPRAAGRARRRSGPVVRSAFPGVTARSPPSSTDRPANTSIACCGCHGRISRLWSRIAAGPKRAPVRKLVAVSNGTPTHGDVGVRPVVAVRAAGERAHPGVAGRARRVGGSVAGRHAARSYRAAALPCTMRPPTIVISTSVSEMSSRRDREQVAVEHDQVGELAALERAGHAVLVHRVRRVDRDRAQRLAQRQARVGVEAPGVLRERRAPVGLAQHGDLEREELVERVDGKSLPKAIRAPAACSWPSGSYCSTRSGPEVGHDRVGRVRRRLGPLERHHRLDAQVGEAAAGPAWPRARRGRARAASRASRPPCASPATASSARARRGRRSRARGTGSRAARSRVSSRPSCGLSR